MRVNKPVLFFLLILVFSCASETQKEIPQNVPAKGKEHLLLLCNGVKKSYADTVYHHLQNAFGVPVKTLSLPELPVRLHSSIHKDRYRADSILRFLENKYAGQALKVILFTHYDISTTKYSNFAERKIKEPENRYRDWAIFGLGSCLGYTCVVSDRRLWAHKAKETTYLRRVKNIAVHEVGHTFGLPHCPEPECVMNDANETILTIDRSTGMFCEKCKLQLGL